ncbi:WD40 repeat-like protein [Neocallimastix californiae]|uniref:WD40 repeat-like protein n=1 Tax=Neocallimastix californiae TaxID=1754190 RepID=A0A1Y2BC68_9FUNG|nr:WD40 repeat-like protein [Neocallimastix californiae]|eukprot:ORY32354.1 WD40 repeat-like protein [Neocallimastix californiae]
MIPQQQTNTNIKKLRNKVKAKSTTVKKRDNEQYQKYKYGNMSLTPTSVTTTIITKTTTTTEYPPLYFAPPELPEDSDSSSYPLAKVPTPYNLKNFQFDLNGSPTYFKEIEIDQPETHTIGNGLKITKTNTVNSKLISNSSSPYIKRINRKRPAPDIDPLIQNDMYFEDEESKDSSSHLHDVSSICKPHKRHASQQDVNPHEEVFGNNVKISTNRTTSATPTTSLNLSDSECNKNLPSPSMSPTPDSKMKNDNEVKDEYLDIVSNNPSALKDLTDLTHNQEIPVSNIPYIISTFDVLPPTMKSYILLHLLRRCRVPTLQYISSLILTSLKYDFFGLLPVDISYHIIQYLDFRSIAVCSQVSKSWYKLFNSPGVDTSIWKYRLKNDFWIDEKETDSNALSFDNDIRNNVLEDLSDENKENFASLLQNQGYEIPPNLYKYLYRRHYLLKSNWNNGRCHQVSFPGNGSMVVTCLQFDDDKIISGSDDNIINIYDTATGKLRKKLTGHTGGVWVLHYYGNTLVSGSTDRTVRIWDIEEGKCTHQFEGHTSTVRCLQILIPTKNPITGKIEPEYPLIVTGSRDTTLRVWRLPDTKKDKPYFPQSQQQAQAATQQAININDQDQLSTMPIIGIGQQGQQSQQGQGQSVQHQVQGDPNANVNIINNIAGRMNLVNTTSSISNNNNNVNPYFLHTLHGHTQSVRAVAGSGNVLVSGSYDSTVRVWDLRTGESVHLLRGHLDKVYSVGYSPELELAASGSMDTFVRVWSTKTGQCLYQLEGHSSLVGLLEISPNYIVSAAADNTLRIWSPSTGRFISALYGHTAAITCFHHDAKLNRIVSGSEGAIKLWELCSDERKNKSQGQPLLSEAGGGVSSKINYGTYKRDLVTGIQCVWKIEIDERRLVCAYQRGVGNNIKTWFEVLDYGEGLHTLEEEFVKNNLGSTSSSINKSQQHSSSLSLPSRHTTTTTTNTTSFDPNTTLKDSIDKNSNPTRSQGKDQTVIDDQKMPISQTDSNSNFNTNSNSNSNSTTTSISNMSSTSSAEIKEIEMMDSEVPENHEGAGETSREGDRTEESTSHQTLSSFPPSNASTTDFFESTLS